MKKEFANYAADPDLHKQARALRAQGYKDICSDHLFILMASPDGGRMILLSLDVKATERFFSLCRENMPNPYLPDFVAFRTIKSDSGTEMAIAEMERLLHIDEVPIKVRPTVGGFGRALGLLIEGHPSHKTVHDMMMRDGAVAAARQAIADVLQTGDGKELFYNGRFEGNAGDCVDDWHAPYILFRLENEGRRWRPVFFAPLTCQEPKAADMSCKKGPAIIRGLL